MNIILNQIKDQYYRFKKDISSQKIINIGTLGPKGTSSSHALEYFTSTIKKHDPNKKIKTSLSDNFDEVYENLQNGKIEYALIPCAYEKITDFFWNCSFENSINFIFETPEYGIATKKDYIMDIKSNIKVSCGPAVENIIGYLSDGLLIRDNIEIIKVSSTTEAIQHLIKGHVDLAVTNQTSFDLYENNELKFIQKKHKTSMVWSVFHLKSNCLSSIIND